MLCDTGILTISLKSKSLLRNGLFQFNTTNQSGNKQQAATPFLDRHGKNMCEKAARFTQSVMLEFLREASGLKQGYSETFSDKVT